MPGSRSVSLYVHVPFCRAKCAYCDFFSVPAHTVPPDVQDSFVRAVLSECLFYKERFGIDQWRTVYVGGGTPTMLSPSSLSRLLGGIADQGLLPGAEITVEANPETLTRETLRALSDAGTGRLSLGLQSMSGAALSACGRHCGSRQNARALELVSGCWDGDLSLDCMAGLPSQTDAEFLGSLDLMLAASPDHFSLYTLTLEEGTPLFGSVERGDIPFSADDADRQWFLGRDRLVRRGFSQYEVSNFARGGHECVHNMAYWTQADYVGAGPGACGTLYDFDAGHGVRLTNGRDIASYRAFWEKGAPASGDIPCAVQETEALDRDTLSFEYLMLSLRTVRGADEGLYRSRYGGDLGERLSRSRWWSAMLQDGRALVTGSPGSRRYSLTPDGMLLLNPLLSSLPEC